MRKNLQLSERLSFPESGPETTPENDEDFPLSGALYIVSARKRKVIHRNFRFKTRTPNLNTK